MGVAIDAAAPPRNALVCDLLFGALLKPGFGVGVPGFRLFRV